MFFVVSFHSPNAICYKIGEKICDQFNNAFILMVSDTCILFLALLENVYMYLYQLHKVTFGSNHSSS